jgi:hypothetical protein
MGDVYSIKRLPDFTTRTRILATKDGRVETQKIRFEPSTPTIESVLAHSLGESPWVGGESIHTMIVRELAVDGPRSLHKRLSAPVALWWAAVLDHAAMVGDRLPAALLDCHWQNALNVGGRVNFIDREWAWREGVSPGWLIYRSVAKFVEDEVFFVHRWSRSCRLVTPYAIVKATARIAGVRLNMPALMDAIELESQLHLMVSGRKYACWAMALRLFEPLLFRQLRVRLRRLTSRVLRKLSFS